MVARNRESAINSGKHLPNFFLAGAPKAGTTSLYFYLDQHPEIYMSPIKEPNFFADEIRCWNFEDEARLIAEGQIKELRIYLDENLSSKRFGGLIDNSADYKKLFCSVDAETAIGEASVCYL
jgi:hypothetical protein